MSLLYPFIKLKDIIWKNVIAPLNFFNALLKKCIKVQLCEKGKRQALQ